MFKKEPTENEHVKFVNLTGVSPLEGYDFFVSTFNFRFVKTKEDVGCIATSVGVVTKTDFGKDTLLSMKNEVKPLFEMFDRKNNAVSLLFNFERTT